MNDTKLLSPPLYRSNSPSSICGIDWAQLATLLLPLLHALAQFSVLELCLLKAALGIRFLLELLPFSDLLG